MKTRREVIENLEYLISGECCDSHMNYVDEIQMAITDMKICDANNAGWISVKDRWPDLESDYLVTDGHEIPWICRMVKLGGVKAWVNTALHPQVKYWMPLPKPPKEET